MSTELHHPKRNRNNDWLTISAFIVGFLTLLATLYGIKTQLDSLNAQLKQQAVLASAQYILNMSKNLDGSQYAAVRTAIDEHPHTYSPLKAGYADNQLRGYMGLFETIGDLYRDQIVTPQMAYDEFSNDVEKAYCNVDVRSDIASDQQGDASTGTDAFWSGFQGMAEHFLATDHFTCTSTVLDDE